MNASIRRPGFYGSNAWQIPCWQGKMQGISPIHPFFAKICLKNLRKSNPLRVNSLREEQGIILREQGIVFRLSTGAGKSARSRFSSPDEALVPFGRA
ncbi:MAG TPA: hypothetical protein VGL41_08940 [Roseiarcus sp.]|jgi:hypothetical protein